MKIKSVKLGYEMGTGEEVSILPSHLIVTGVTQKSGKTTTLESLINRSKLRAVVFKTKIGEKSFLKGTIIPPFFKDRSDWQFIQGLVEATIKEKLRSFERAKIIQIAKKTGGNSLLEFKRKVDERLCEAKVNAFERDILTNLQAYLEIVLPKLQSINFSNELELVDGLNIIDLERFSRDSEVQSLIIRSVAEEVLHKFKNVVLVIPEAWKFLPQTRGNPCKLVVEEYIRQGASNNNFIWIDSQDMANVDKVPLKQISNWILGYQSEINEVKHTLNQIPLPKSQKPSADEIMTLGVGEFILATREKTVRMYVQPFWLDDERAKEVAEGKLSVLELDAPETITPFKIAVKQEGVMAQPAIDFAETSKRFNRELSELANDFFNKISEVQEQINKVYSEIFRLKNEPRQQVDEESLLRRVLQKMPVSQNNPVIDKESIVAEVLARVPKMAGSVTYEVMPLEKIRQDFLLAAKEKILGDITSLSNDERTVLKYLESIGRDVSPSEIITKCLLLKVGGSQSTKVSNILKSLKSIEVAEKTAGGRVRGVLRERISTLLSVHTTSDDDIDQVYNHVLVEVIG